MDADIRRFVLSRIVLNGQSNTKIAQQSGAAKNTVRRYRRIHNANPITMDTLSKMCDAEVSNYLREGTWRHTKKSLPDWNDVYVLNKKGGYLYQIWQEYFNDSAIHYQYSRFAALYRQWCQSQSHTIYHDHVPGEEAQVDFCGKTVKVISPGCGKNTKAQIFVGVLPYSLMAFVIALPNQKSESWLYAHKKMFEYFTKVPRTLICDNLKSAVIKSGKEPTLNRLYRDLGLHYRIDIVPTRPRKPKDKGLVENTVGVVTRWILWRLERQNFFSIDEINQAIAPLLMKFNSAALKKFPDESRWSRFAQKERHLMQDLPDREFIIGKWLPAQTVRQPYHVCINKHSYSVPYRLIGKQVVPKVCEKEVVLYHDGKVVARHALIAEKGGITTDETHRSTSEKAVIGVRYEDAITWANELDVSMVKVIEKQFKNRSRHSRRAKQACYNIMKLVKDYGEANVITACQHEAISSQYTYTALKRCLAHKTYLNRAEAIQTQLPLDFRGEQP